VALNFSNNNELRPSNLCYLSRGFPELRYNSILKFFTYLFTITEIVFNSAWAGPPFVTDDPEPVEYHHWEINYGVTDTLVQGSASIGLPSIDINYGIAPDIQLHAQPRYSYEKSTTNRRFGIDDTEVGFKYRFLNIEQGDSSFMAGIYPMFQLPTGDTKLGPDRGKHQSFLPLWLQYTKKEWTSYGGAGYRINPGAGNKNSVFLGAATLYQFTPSLQFGGEIFHQTPDSTEGKSTSGVNLGGSYNLAHDYNFLFSAGRGLDYASSTNQLSVYLALQVLY